MVIAVINSSQIMLTVNILEGNEESSFNSGRVSLLVITMGLTAQELLTPSGELLLSLPPGTCLLNNKATKQKTVAWLNNHII